jgi:protocatechuate 3,4-dioxygenase alpha subunit
VSLGTAWAADAGMVDGGAPGAVVVTGSVLDGSNMAVTDALLELYQADGQGRLPPEVPRSWTGFTRAFTGTDGRYRVVTLKPGALPGTGGGPQAPHIDVSIFARGLLQRLVTRIYFSDEEANQTDPVLAGLEPGLRPRLVAQLTLSEEAPPTYNFDIHLQGERETVFFAI